MYHSHLAMLVAAVSDRRPAVGHRRYSVPPQGRRYVLSGAG